MSGHLMEVLLILILFIQMELLVRAIFTYPSVKIEAYSKTTQEQTHESSGLMSVGITLFAFLVAWGVASFDDLFGRKEDKNEIVKTSRKSSKKYYGE